MSAEIIVALITGAFTFAGVVITVAAGNRKTGKQIQEQNELTLYRIEQLEKKQEKHNKLVERMFNAEEKIGILDEKQKVADHRIADLEKKVG